MFEIYTSAQGLSGIRLKDESLIIKKQEAEKIWEKIRCGETVEDYTAETFRVLQKGTAIKLYKNKEFVFIFVIPDHKESLCRECFGGLKKARDDE